MHILTFKLTFLALSKIVDLVCASVASLYVSRTRHLFEEKRFSYVFWGNMGTLPTKSAVISVHFSINEFFCIWKFFFLFSFSLYQISLQPWYNLFFKLNYYGASSLMNFDANFLQFVIDQSRIPLSSEFFPPTFNDHNESSKKGPCWSKWSVRASKKEIF